MTNRAGIVHEVHDQQTDTYVVRFEQAIWVCTVGMDPASDVIITPTGQTIPMYDPSGQARPEGVVDEVWACLERAWELMG